MLNVWAAFVPWRLPVRTRLFLCLTVLFTSLACQPSLQNKVHSKEEPPGRDIGSFVARKAASKEAAQGAHNTDAPDTPLLGGQASVGAPLHEDPVVIGVRPSGRVAGVGAPNTQRTSRAHDGVLRIGVSQEALLGAFFRSKTHDDQDTPPPYKYIEIPKQVFEGLEPDAPVSSYNMFSGMVSGWGPTLSVSRARSRQARGATPYDEDVKGIRSILGDKAGRNNGANAHKALQGSFGGFREGVTIPSPLAHSLLYRTRDITNPLNFANLLAEGQEWFIPGNPTLWESLGRRVDSFFSGLFLKTASILPNYKRNVIIYYKEYKPSMWIEMFGLRNEFIRKLASLFQGVHRIQSVYLRNLGMEIFEIPPLWRVRDFIATILKLNKFVSHVYTDQLINDFDQEVQMPVRNEEGPGSFRGSAEGAGPQALTFEGNHQGVIGSRGAQRRRLDVMTNDPYTWQQWAIIDSGPSRWGIEAPPAWDFWTGQGLNPRFTVAVIDSGVDYEHPDLKNQIWRNPDEICGNGIDDDFNGFVDDCIGWDFVDGTNTPMDENGHGTASAGIIAAEPNNGIGLTGVCWGCEIVVLKALNKEIKGTISAFARSLDYAIGKGVMISNNSYGGRGNGFRALQEAVQRARQAGMIVVAAAGNYNGNNDNDEQPVYPASYDLDNIVSVAAISRSGHLAPFSSYGKRNVDVAAPGTNIVTTSVQKTYRSVSGTSFAVPMVTGVLALLWTHRPYLNYRQVIQRLLGNVKKNYQLEGLIATGGVVDAWRSLTGQEFADSYAARPALPSTCDTAACSPYATCTLSNGAPRCACRKGFQGDGKICQDIDECIFSPCGPASVCVNTVGSYQCKCRKGFVQTQDSCNDIDECLLGSQNLIPLPCPLNSRCRNYSGSFDCICPIGTVWNALSGPAAHCLRINSPPSGPCRGNGGCGINSLCQIVYTPTGTTRKCNCVKGYKALQLDNPELAVLMRGSSMRSFDNTVCIREDILPEEQAFFLLSSHKDRLRELRQGSGPASSVMQTSPNNSMADYRRPADMTPTAVMSYDVPTPLTASRGASATYSSTQNLPFPAAFGRSSAPHANTPVQNHVPTPLMSPAATSHTLPAEIPVAKHSCLFGVCV